MHFDVNLNDVRSLVSTRTFTDEGFLQVDANLSCVGVVDYLASDFEKSVFPNHSANDVIKVYRSPEVLFSDSTLNSFKAKPMTNGHPISRLVTPKIARAVQIGHVTDSVKRKGDFINLRLMITDEASIELVNSKPAYLSAGYGAKLAVGKGTTPEGQHFDAKLTEMKGNHVALTESPRAGYSCKILDSNEQIKPIEEKRMAKVKINDIDVEINADAQGAVQMLIDSKNALEIKRDEVNQKLTDSKSKNEKLQGEVDALKTTLNDEAVFVKKVDERVQLISDARSVFPKIDYKQKTARDIRVEVIKGLNDSFDATDKSDEYIEGRFDTLVDAHSKQTKSSNDMYSGHSILKDAMDKNEKVGSLSANARNELRKRNAEAWSQPIKGEK